ncbi:MAG: diguanylate cyclase [Rhodoferax sp.]|nr:diguanylate cyclase [Rhodoferax sp.]
MESSLLAQIVLGAQLGFALLQVICDENGNPIDAELREANALFLAAAGLPLSNAQNGKIRTCAVNSPIATPEMLRIFQEVERQRGDRHIETFFETTQRWFDIRVFSPQEKLVAVVLDDITKRKRFEIALKIESAFWNEVVDSCPGIFFMLLGHGQFVMWNRAMRQGADATEQRMASLSIQELTDDRDRGLISQVIKDALEGTNREVALDLKSLSGHRSSYFISCQRISLLGQEYVIGSGFDISERFKAEQLLRQQKQFSEDVINSLPGVFYMLNVRGQFKRVNNLFVEVTGYSRDEIAHMNALDLFAGEDKQLIAKKMQEVFEQGKSWAEAEFITKSGQGIPYYFTGQRTCIDGESYLVGLGTDISERKAAEAAFRIAAIAFESQESMLITDANRVTLRVNKAFTALTGYMAEEIIGQNPRMLRSGRHGSDFYSVMWNSINNAGTWEGEIWNRRKNGEVFPAHQTITAVKNRNGIVTNYVGTLIDITQQKRSEEIVWYKANFDQLTGLANRSLFFDRFSKEISRARRSNKHVALLFLDLDGFKAVNDVYGHDAGDDVLKEVSRRWLRCVREVDTVARVGGDEFAIIVGNLDSSCDAIPLAEKLIQELSFNISLSHGKECNVGTSVGISIYPDNGTEMDTLLSLADTAMYESKMRGKNTYTIIDTTTTIGKIYEKWIELDDLSLVGVAVLDEQHRQFVRMLNHVNHAIAINKIDVDIKKLFNEVLKLVKAHFATELNLMVKYNFPTTALHELEHEKMLMKLIDNIHQGNELLTLHSVKDYLLDHFKHSDKYLGDFLKSHGVS